MAAHSDPELLFLDASGRILIPAAIRKKLGVKPGEKIAAWVEDGRLVLRSRAEVIRELRELFRRKPGEERMVETLRRTRKEEFARELKRYR